MNARIVWLPALLLAMLAAASSPRADDTEIYQAEVSGAATARPQVLIVFDDSGSMATQVDQQRPPYDPNASYDSKFGTDRIYWSDDATVPDVGSDNWFEASQNRCASSYDSLAENGAFQTTAARRWRDSELLAGDCRYECPTGQTFWNLGCWQWYWGSGWNREGDAQLVCEDETEVPGSWLALSDEVTDPPHVDCLNDVATGNPGNGTEPDGYPQNNVTSGSEYGDTLDDSEALWGDTPYGFYTSHYLDWYHDDTLVEPRPRIDIARDVVSQLIDTNPGVDFGLLEFNQGFLPNPVRDGRHGGRVVRRIIEEASEDDREELIDLVAELTANGSTPLCESFYEAYRYIAGLSPVYADNAGTDAYDPLDKDAAAEAGGSYVSPTTDCAYSYVIIMTDGEPQLDNDATSRIEQLTGQTCSVYPNAPLGGQPNQAKNCMPELAEYLANTDLDGDPSNGDQFGITYTIGFATDQQLLSDTAQAGKGRYYTANNAQELAEAFQGAIYEILSSDTTFTSPAVAVDTFTRTQSRDEVFYAMFKPTERVNWPGNIKKLKLSETDDGGAVLVDANGSPAIDDNTGFIKDSATTFWSSGQDGGAVEAGGVGGRLRQRSPDARTIYTDTGPNEALESFDVDNFSPADFGVVDNASLWALFGAGTAEAYERQVRWARGYDAYDEDGDGSSDDVRAWVLGDILHSQPLAVNYGATAGFSEDNPDLRLLVGTNAGFVHMFGASDGEEDWAFTPKALAPLHAERRRNEVGGDNVYGMDLTPVAYRLDLDQDGTIDAGSGEKVYAYFGMRRGGRGYYALDISNPGSPDILWSVKAGDSGFAELGQSWSQPVVTFIPGYADNNGKPKPVLAFGAGYDPAKDAGGVATADSMGRGLFIVDAATGALVWSVTPAADSASNLQETDLQHSVAAEVTPIDGNGDGLSDRIYFGDTGGSVWRVDMPGNALPDSAQDTWHIVKLADINGGAVASDRRIHNGLDVVRTRFAGRAVDAVIFATGDRTNPNATDVDNRLYMIRDEAVSTYTTPAPTTSECTDEDFEGDLRCALPFVDSDLYDITDNALAAEDDATVIAELAEYSGWRFDLQGLGEKGLARTLTLGGKVYATSFTPNDLLNNINICEPLSGQGKLYVISLFDGDRALLNLAPVIPDTPTPYFGEDGIRLLLPPGTPPQDDGPINVDRGVIDLEEVIPPLHGNYWMREEF